VRGAVVYKAGAAADKTAGDCTLPASSQRPDCGSTCGAAAHNRGRAAKRTFPNDYNSPRSSVWSIIYARAICGCEFQREKNDKKGNQGAHNGSRCRVCKKSAKKAGARGRSAGGRIGLRRAPAAGIVRNFESDLRRSCMKLRTAPAARCPPERDLMKRRFHRASLLFD
jgi:hypothetical protein